MQLLNYIHAYCVSQPTQVNFHRFNISLLLVVAAPNTHAFPVPCRLVSYAASRTAHELLPEDVAAVLRGSLEKQAEAKQQEAAAAAAAAEAAAAEAAAAAPAAAEPAAAAGDDSAVAAEGAAAPTADAPAAAAAAAADDESAVVEPQEAGDAEMSEAALAAAEPAAETGEAPAAAAAPAATAASTAAAEAAAAAAKAAADAQAAAAAAAEAAASDDSIKALWLQQQEAVYSATKQQQEARQQYESAIRRPYWHVKPLDAAQLRNWAAYLGWQEAQGDLGLTVRLYERCCVPCASYPGDQKCFARLLAGCALMLSLIAVQGKTRLWNHDVRCTFLHTPAQ
jgi:pre-mRNA-processing factor 39